MVNQSGLVTPELMEQIEENIHYATFSVARGKAAEEGTIEEMLSNAYGSSVGAKIFRQVGTLERIEDPAAATVMKMISLMDAARRNQARKEIVQLLRNEFPKEITPADTRWSGTRNEIVMKDSSRVGTMVVMEQGKAQGFYVPKAFVAPFERDNPVELSLILKMLSMPSRGVKNLLTQLNYGFWPVAHVRDIMAYHLKMPRVSKLPFGGPRFWRYYRQALADSWRSVIGAPNAGALESLTEQDWITVANPMASREEGESIDRLLERYWQDPSAMSNEDLLAIHLMMMRWMDMGQVFERTTKRVGRLYLEDYFPDMPEHQKLFMVHNFSGSPNFLRKGAGNVFLDSGSLYFNPMKESVRSTFLSAKDSPATMAWNVAKYGMQPKIMMWLFASGAFIDLLLSMGVEEDDEVIDLLREIKRMYSFVSEYDKTNYSVIVLGWDDRAENKVVSLRMPMAEELRIVGGLTWKLLNRSEDPQQVLNYMGGQLPVGNPVWEVPLAWAQFMTGRNPYDWFRGAHILSDDEAQAQDHRGYRQMGKYTWNALGGSIIHRFDLHKTNEKTGKTERFLDLPIISNALGRWIKVSNRGRADTLRSKVSLPLRREQAQSLRG